MVNTEIINHLDTITLADAVLCCDCEVISKRRANARCAVCGSGSTLSLSAVVSAMATAACEYIDAGGWPHE